ncbi:MAG: HYR domain-containing protein, partial [Saprospiraceae bacterium]|nr:HYR domain-containing protein [Saprospiraceae bacterium]
DIQLAPQSCETAVNWTVPTFTDNCSMASVTNPTYNSGDIFQAGTYLLNYTGTDLVGNSNVCEFTINVIENTAPVIINCPQDQIINVADAECSANVTWTAPTATDNCGTVDLISNFSPGLFEVGTSIVIYTATDQSGNTTTCSFRVTVRDNIDPVIVDGCPQNISVEADPNQCGAVVNWTLPTATDNCSQTFMYLTTSDPGDFYTVGSHLVIVSALDASNNLASCSFQINVIDRDAPVVSNCPTEIRTTASIGSCSKSVSWTPPTFTDACDTTLQIIASANPGSLFPLGTTTVTYNALDESGNIASCSFDVIVEHPPVNIDVTPIATQYCVGSDVTLSIINGYNATFSWGGQNTSDTRDLTIDSITTADQGTYIAYVTFSNGCQYIDSVSILVNPTPNVAIQHNTVGCASNDSDLTLTEVGGDALAWNWSGPNFTSNLQSPTISNATPSNSGTYAVTVTNQFGCTNVAQQEILVQNTLASPLIYSNATEICQNQPFLMSGSLYANPNVQYYFFSSPATGSGMDTLTNGPVVSIIPTQAGVYSYYYYYTSGECVSDTASLLVTVLAAPNVNVIGSTNLMCVDSNTELTLLDLGGDATSWNWISPIGENISSTSGFTLSNLNESNIGTYTVNATNELGCTTKVEIPVSITFKPATPQITSTTTNHCLGSEISLTGTYYEGDSISYEWTALPFENAGLPTDVNSNTILVTPTSAGAYSYSYYVTNGSCISDPASFVIEVQAAPSVLAVSNSPITCLSLSDTLKLFETSGDATSWSWTGPNNFGSFEQNPIRQNISSSDAGIYTVVGYSSLGCVGYDTIEVVITQKPILPTISAQDLMVCLGDSIKIFGPNLPVGYEYNWVGPNVTSVTSQNLVISNAAASNTGAYSLIVTSQGCSSDASEPIYVYVLSAPDIIDDLVSISFGTDPVTFSVITNDIYVNTANVTTTVQTEPTHGTLINNNDGTFSYTPSGPFVETDQFIYKICYDECPTSCDVGIVTLDISSDGSVCVIPNVITPNDDQINDELYIPCLENDKNPNNELIIYNQWGDQVFYANPYLNNWKGTYNNKDLPDGTYYYLFKRTTDSTPVKGFITIYR